MKRYGVICLFILFVLFIYFPKIIYSDGGGAGNNVAQESANDESDESLDFMENVEEVSESKRDRIINENNFFQVESSFVSDILAVETALLAFLIPLSFDIITRVSDKYNSRTIAKQFKNEPFFRMLLYLLFGNVVFLVLLSFFDVANKALLFLAGVSVLFTLFFLFKFLQLLFSYTTDTKYLRRKFLSNAQKHV